ncbi:MAG: outer membrane protein assembly factor BamB family protein [Promethearchaeota archaeon]
MKVRPEVAWEHRLDSPVLRVEGWFVSDEPIICAGTRSGHVHVLDARTGEIVTSFPASSRGAPLWDLALVDITGNGTPEVASGGLEGRLAVHALDGTLLWDNRCDNSIGSVVVADLTSDGNLEVACGSLDRTLRVLEGKTGKYIWGQVFTSGVGPVEYVKPTSGRGAGEGCVVVGTNDGVVKCFEASSGETRWEYSFNSSSSSGGTPMVRFCRLLTREGGNGIVVGADNSPVTELDLDTGEPTRKFPGIEYPWECVTAGGPYTKGALVFITNFSFEQFGNDGDERGAGDSGGDAGVKAEPHDSVFCIDGEFQLAWKFSGIAPGGGPLNVETVDLSPSRKFLCIGCSPGSLLLLSAETGKVVSMVEFDYTVNSVVMLGETGSGEFATFTGDDGNWIKKLKWKTST